ncbi:MAG: hypothetical protein LBV33_08750, partial [Lachnospiraceae bacterium]|nr:hypothetical protein [Lachnospiraceae bacterium]
MKRTIIFLVTILTMVIFLNGCERRPSDIELLPITAPSDDPAVSDEEDNTLANVVETVEDSGNRTGTKGNEEIDGDQDNIDEVSTNEGNTDVDNAGNETLNTLDNSVTCFVHV